MKRSFLAALISVPLFLASLTCFLCASGFLALGLPATDPFWADSFAEWTNLKAWQGKEVLPDHALREELPLKVSGRH